MTKDHQLKYLREALASLQKRFTSFGKSVEEYAKARVFHDHYTFYSPNVVKTDSTLRDMATRVATADQLGHEVVLKLSKEGHLELRYRRKLQVPTP